MSEPGDTEPPRRFRPLILYLLAAGFLIGLIVLLVMTTGDTPRGAFEAGHLIILGTFLVLLGPAVFVGKISRNLRHMAVWLAIIGVLVLLYGVWEGSGPGGLKGLIAPQFDSAGSPGVARFQANRFGHFVAHGAVNGEPVTFLIDTGASRVALAPHHARKVGFDPDALSYDQLVNTANGTTHAARVRLDSVTVGGITLENVPALVNQAPMNDSLLGMTFLERLSGYEVRDDVLTLYE